MSRSPVSNRLATVRLVGLFLMSLAVLGTATAISAYVGLCVKREAQTGACIDSSPDWQLVAQLVAGIAGFLFAAIALYLAWHAAFRRAALMLAITVLTYATWAVLLDASTVKFNLV